MKTDSFPALKPSNKPKKGKEKRRRRLFTKDAEKPDMRERVVKHHHPFEVREDRRSETEIKETIIIPSMPDFKGSTLRIRGSIDTDVDLEYGHLHVFDSDNAIDHFASIETRGGNWKVSIRRAWLEGRAFPVYVDPTLTVAQHDLHLYRDTGGCFAPDVQILMENGETKRIDEVRIGDVVAEFGRVLATLQVDGRGCNIYDYNGIVVTDDHPVKYQGRWMMVEDVARRETVVCRRLNIGFPVLHSIETQGKRLLAQSSDGAVTHFAAYDGCADGAGYEFEKSVVELLNSEDDANAQSQKTA